MLGHLTGIAQDWVAGSLNSYASTHWTAVQVARNARLSLPDLMAAGRSWPIDSDHTAERRAPEAPDRSPVAVSRLSVKAPRSRTVADAHRATVARRNSRVGLDG